MISGGVGDRYVSRLFSPFVTLSVSYILRYTFPIFLLVPLTYMRNTQLPVPYFRSDTLADFTSPLLTPVQYRACSLIWHFQALLSSPLPETTK